MLILFDHGTPRSISRSLKGHVVVEAIDRGWSRLSNSTLLKVAEDAVFEGIQSLSAADVERNVAEPNRYLKRHGIEIPGWLRLCAVRMSRS